MTTARTAAERKADERERRRAEGLQELRGLWLPPRLHAVVKGYAQRQIDADSKRRRRHP